MLNKKIIIGGAQLGNRYGIFSDKTKMTNETEIKKIFNFSIKKKLKYIDTAHDYGNSEKVIGKFSKNKFKIISKVNVPKKLSKKKMRVYLNKKIKISLKKLKVKSLDGLLLHNFDFFLKNKKKLHNIFNILIELKNAKLIKKIGISTYFPEKAHKYYEKFNFDIIQAPYNIFDQRLSKSKIYKLKKYKNIEIHTRSIFLQGVLIKKEYPKYFNKWKIEMNNYFYFIKKNNINPLCYCLNFALKDKRINKIIIGFQSLIQLKEILKKSLKNNNFKNNTYKNFESKNLNLIIPGKWQIK